MRELLRDPEAMANLIRRRALRGLMPVMGKLARAARGHKVFESDHEMRACIALARLAPALMGESPDPIDDTWWTPEREENARLLDEAHNITREQCAESWADEFRKTGADDLKYETEEQAREYGRRLWDQSRAVDDWLEKQLEPWRLR